LPGPVPRLTATYRKRDFAGATRDHARMAVIPESSF